MRLFISILLIASALIFSPRSEAYFLSGNAMIGYIDQADEDEGNLFDGLVLGFITGVHDSSEVLRSEQGICIPDNATVGQLRAIFTKFLKENPEIWDKPAWVTALVAFKVAFPC